MIRPQHIALTAFLLLLHGQASAQRFYDAPTTMANLVSDAGFKHCKKLVKNFYKKTTIGNVYATLHTNSEVKKDTLQLSAIWGEKNDNVITELTLRQLGRRCVASFELMFNAEASCPEMMSKEPAYTQLYDHVGIIHAELKNGSRKYLYPTGENSCMVIYRHNAVD